jgi:hypothetical protein
MWDVYKRCCDLIQDSAFLAVSPRIPSHVWSLFALPPHQWHVTRAYQSKKKPYILVRWRGKHTCTANFTSLLLPPKQSNPNSCLPEMYHVAIASRNSTWHKDPTVSTNSHQYRKKHPPRRGVSLAATEEAERKHQVGRWSSETRSKI